MIKKKINFFGIVAFALLLIGCLPQAESVDQKTYMLAVDYPRPINSTVGASLLINDTTTAPAFSDNQFVYRLSKVTYSKDFYNIFFVPVNQQISNILYNAFQKSAAFSDVEQAGSLLPTEYVLKTNIIDLYADYQIRSHPSAVLNIQVILYKQEHDKLKTLLRKTYHASQTLKNRNSEALVTGWSDNLTKILPTLISDVKVAIKNDRPVYSEQAPQS